ncbi:MAG: hypothetical protein WCF23_01000, partial [Candidatus Nitrosopolaris sp.]
MGHSKEHERSICDNDKTYESDIIVFVSFGLQHRLSVCRSYFQLLWSQFDHLLPDLRSAFTSVGEVM